MSIQTPPGARFGCQSCGACCQGWAVPVDQATVDRLRTRDWGGDPFEQVPTAGAPYRTRLVDGRCFFLDAQNRCRIHSELSYDAKPAVCRAFPLSVLEVGGKQYARLSFWCPTVVANTGKPLESQARWLKETARHADRRTVALTINGQREASSRDVDRVHQALRSVLGDTAWPLDERLAAASELVARLDTASRREGPALADTVAAAVAEGLPALAAEARQRGAPSAARRVLALYLMQDRRPGRMAALGRLCSVTLFFAGTGKLRSRAVPGRASWRQVRAVAFDLSEASDALITRYLLSKVDSRRYIAGDATLVSGFNLLVAAYALIDVLARLRAASARRRQCDEEDVRLAVRAADLLAVEHAGGFEGRTQAALTGIALADPDLCGGMMQYLGKLRN